MILGDGLMWAIPVEPNVLGAALESYTFHRAAINTLRECAQTIGPQPVTRLPTEIVDLIAAQVMLDGHEARFKEWTRCLDCMQNTCRTADHVNITEQDTGKIWRDFLSYVRQKAPEVRNAPARTRVAADKALSMNKSDRRGRVPNERPVDSVHSQMSMEGRKRYLKEGGRHDYGGGLHDYDEVLAIDFGLEIVIKEHVWGLHDSYKLHLSQGLAVDITSFNWRADARSLEISDTIVFLCLPQLDLPVVRSHTTGCVIGTYVDASSLTLSPCYHRRFGIAMRMLGLRPYVSLYPPAQLFPSTTERIGRSLSEIYLYQRRKEAALERLWMKREKEIGDVGMGEDLEVYSTLAVSGESDEEDNEESQKLEKLSLTEGLEEDMEREMKREEWPKLMLL